MVKVSDSEVQLTPTDYDLLRTLVTNAGKVITHRHLLRQVWGSTYEEVSHLLRVHMSNLRSKIEPELVSARVISSPSQEWVLDCDWMSSPQQRTGTRQG